MKFGSVVWSPSLSGGVERARLALARGGFAASIAVLTGGTILAHSITVLVSPILTRIYSPGEIGQLGLYTAFIAVASVGASLRYETAIVSAQDAEEAAYLGLVSMALVVPMGLVAVMVLHWLMHRSLLGFGTLPSYTILLAFPSLAGTSAYVVLRYWCVREREFPVISQIVVLQNIGRAVSQVGLGLLRVGLPGLLLGDLLGRSLGVGRMARFARQSIATRLSPIEYSRVVRVLWAYRKCPIYGFPSSLMDATAVNLPLPLIAHFHGPQATGYVVLVQTVLALPMILVGASVADVFHRRIATYAREEPGQVTRFFLRTAGGLFALGAGPAVVLVLFGERLFGLVFGDRWTVAGSLAAAMAPWAVAQLVVSPLARVVLVFQNHELKLVYDVLSLAAVVGVLAVWDGGRLPLTEAIVWLSMAQTMTNAVYFFLLLRMVAGASRG